MRFSNPFYALRKALISQCHPKMLFAILLPFLVGLVALLILLIFAWNPFDAWLLSQFSHWQWLQSSSHYLGMASMSSWLSWFISFITLISLSAILGLASAAIFITPMALKQLSTKNYPQLSRLGSYANTVSIANAIKVSTIFVIGWLITLPLWLIPFMSIVLSVFWGAYAFSQMCKVDAIVEHATALERRFILKTNRWGFWIIGLVCALISLIPFMGLIMPVFSILACTHYALSALTELRQHPEFEAILAREQLLLENKK